MKIYHVTTRKKIERYYQSGFIKRPVRGFNTIKAAMAWAIKTGRNVIYEIDSDDSLTYKLPDHHNKYGEAYWIDKNILVDNIKCVFSEKKMLKCND